MDHRISACPSVEIDDGQRAKPLNSAKVLALSPVPVLIFK